MSDSLHPLAELLRQDRRYKLDAYLFVFEALNYAQKVLGMGTETPSPTGKKPAKRPPKRPKPSIKGKLTGKEKEKPESEQEPETERHLTGQQLCEAIRQYALEQYGLMAKCVLNSWGIHQTGDFGEIVFNLIRIEQMRKTDQDRREDFDNVFDFETELCQRYKITRPEE
jgi:uncharacterized repeat protein (TIGR04138 family)